MESAKESGCPSWVRTAQRVVLSELRFAQLGLLTPVAAAKTALLLN
jgi:hypothetical protein